jgi:hypothetical protein
LVIFDHPAEYALPVDDEFVAAERRRTARSGAGLCCGIVSL